MLTIAIHGGGLSFAPIRRPVLTRSQDIEFGRLLNDMSSRFEIHPICGLGVVNSDWAVADTSNDAIDVVAEVARGTISTGEEAAEEWDWNCLDALLSEIGMALKAPEQSAQLHSDRLTVWQCSFTESKSHGLLHIRKPV
jgi:hypothetical protein